MFRVSTKHEEVERVILSSSTLAEWVGKIGATLQSLADRLAMGLRERSVLHADETPVAQLDPGRGKTKRAYRTVICNHNGAASALVRPSA